MKKMECDIIQDLIPSYVDGICSDATRECVEEHMENCEECRKMVALCREKEIAGEQMEQRELDGLKKIKQVIKYKGIACCALVGFILAYLGIAMFIGLRRWSLPDTPHFYLVLWFTCLCLVCLSGIGRKGKKAPGRLDVVLGVISVATDVYVLVISIILLAKIGNGADRIFGMELSKSGPFIAWQMGVGYLVLFQFFLWHLICAIRQGKRCNWLLCLDVTGCCIILECSRLLYAMSNIKTLTYWMVEIGVIGLFGIVASFLMGKLTDF